MVPCERSLVLDLHSLTYPLLSSCWLLELAREVPTSWKLEGFDISALQYPATEYLPSNVSLGTLDAFGTIPENLVGRFDVVHIRAFTVVVKGGNPGTLLDNVTALLSTPLFLLLSCTFQASEPSHARETSAIMNRDKLKPDSRVELIRVKEVAGLCFRAPRTKA